MLRFGRRKADDRKLRTRMVKEQLRRRGIRDEGVLSAFERVPRHAFADGVDLARCYGDHPLPISCGQTMSQPYVVAYMLETAGIGEDDRVLEIGAGCGYQTALLAELAHQVMALEYHEELATPARHRLHRLGYAGVDLRVGDGHFGWPGGGVFDVVIGSAAAPRIPDPLLAQLAPEGRLVMPQGAGTDQQLVLVRRCSTGFDQRRLLPVRFVPFLGEG